MRLGWLKGIPVRRMAATALCLGAMLALTGCTVPNLLIARLPRSCRPLPPWGPEANRARAVAQTQAVPPDAEADRWAEFGRRYLQDGDILFCKGRSSTLDGSYISDVLAHLTDSPFSH